MTYSHYFDINLEDLATYAGLGYTLERIADLLEVNYSDLQRAYFDVDSDVRRAYDRGVLESETKVRLSIQGLASGGSHYAQRQYAELMMRREYADLKKYLDEL